MKVPFLSASPPTENCASFVRYVCECWLLTKRTAGVRAGCSNHRYGIYAVTAYTQAVASLGRVRARLFVLSFFAASIDVRQNRKNCRKW